MRSPALVSNSFSSAVPALSTGVSRPGLVSETRHASSSRGYSTALAGPLLLAQLADRGDPRCERGELALDRGDLLLVLGTGARFLGLLQRLARLRLVQVLAADGGIGEHGDHLRLHFENAAGDEDQLL